MHLPMDVGREHWRVLGLQASPASKTCCVITNVDNTMESTLKPQLRLTAYAETTQMLCKKVS